MIPKKIVSSTTLQIENKKSEKGFILSNFGVSSFN